MAAVSRTTVEDAKPNVLSPKSKGKGTCAILVPKGENVKKRNKTKAHQSSQRAEILMCNLSDADNAKDILCRNVTIYGKCRYEDKGIVTISREMTKVLILARLCVQPQSGKANDCLVRQWQRSG